MYKISAFIFSILVALSAPVFADDAKAPDAMSRDAKTSEGIKHSHELKTQSSDGIERNKIKQQDKSGTPAEEHGAPMSDSAKPDDIKKEDMQKTTQGK